MKGIVFTEFLEMVEDRFSPAVAEEIIAAANLPSGCAYTAVGSYDHAEIVQLVRELSRVTNLSMSDVMVQFGRHLFKRFVAGYPQFFKKATNAFDFLAGVENYIHVEVLKLYPDAELPHFESEIIDSDHMTMIYHSDRGFHDLAEGLMLGCVDHFGEKIDLEKKDLSAGQGTVVRFLLARQKAA